MQLRWFPGEHEVHPHKRSLKRVAIMVFLCYNVYMNKNILNDEWDVLKRFLPNGWEKRAYEVGAFYRKRKIDSPSTLLRVLFIHLAEGKSFRTTSAYAKEAKLCDINDVALLNRLRHSSEWLRWMAVELLKQIRIVSLPAQLLGKYRVRLVDGSVVTEPGSTGADWRIHYSVNLSPLRCDEFSITSPRIAEGFQRYSIEPNDLLIGDRGYCKRKGFVYVLQNNGQLLVRYHSTNLPLYDRRGKRFNVLEHIKSLSLEDGQVGDWDVWFYDPYNKEDLIKGRIISIGKSKEAIEASLKKVRKTAQKRGDKVRPETLEYAKYVTLFVTVNRHNLKDKEVLNLYRTRWQIELMFKRLKSIVKIGHLPKKEKESCIAWLHGKMLLAFLTERIYQEAEFFSPWGYPL
jgi:hypothetical protein